MPGDAIFEKVKQTKDRVYLLYFPSGPRYFFFWMQDNDAEQDEENVKKFNDLVNSGYGSEVSSEPPSRPYTAPTTQSVRPQAARPNAQPAPASRGTEESKAQQQQFMDMLQASLQAQQKPDVPSLTNIFTQENVLKLIQDPEVRQKLIECLPEGQQTEENLQENLCSPQFKSALESLSYAIAMKALDVPKELKDIQGKKKD